MTVSIFSGSACEEAGIKNAETTMQVDHSRRMTPPRKKPVPPYAIVSHNAVTWIT
jgi:hypothetical protein